jgi:hypothetical protein
MPTANIYLSEYHVQPGYPVWEENTAKLREFIASELTCGERLIQAHEISIRLVSVQGKGMIAPIEIEIQAHAYAERIVRADAVCLAVRTYVMNCVNESTKSSRKIQLQDVQVWLILSQLGHSWG